MKLNLKRLKNFGKGIKNIHTQKYKDFINPGRDWLVGLFCAVVVFISGIVFIAIDFYVQFEVPSSDTILDVQTIKYQDKNVIYFSEIYTEKEKTFNQLRGIRFNPPRTNTVTDKVVSTASSTLAEDAVSQ